MTKREARRASARAAPARRRASGGSSRGCRPARRAALRSRCRRDPRTGLRVAAHARLQTRRAMHRSRARVPTVIRSDRGSAGWARRSRTIDAAGDARAHEARRRRGSRSAGNWHRSARPAAPAAMPRRPRAQVLALARAAPRSRRATAASCRGSSAAQRRFDRRLRERVGRDDASARARSAPGAPSSAPTRAPASACALDRVRRIASVEKRVEPARSGSARRDHSI